MSVLRAPVLVIKWFAVVLAVLVWIAVVPIVDLLASALSRIVDFFTGRSTTPHGELDGEPMRPADGEPVRPAETPGAGPTPSGVRPSRH